ncbi:hypothetical protein [Microbacterium candidum]|uniref:Vitamin K epoxide reductase domain-containing protein n=1 Tax=Microbacterium candidum TaxID=3041922 RepID=A0ABT7MU97_9MICO|nr:hypothetical protein [Microbacterium sp. ASV49]MDL9978023.1 hypothetical protein [Microbacterium sp. ASV49]
MVLVALAGLALIWLVMVPVGPEACVLSLPGPRNCTITSRVEAAVIPTSGIFAIGLLSALWAILSPRSAPAARITGIVLLSLAIGVSYLLVAWIPALAGVRQGFQIGT